MFSVCFLLFPGLFEAVFRDTCKKSYWHNGHFVINLPNGDIEIELDVKTH